MLSTSFPEALAAYAASRLFRGRIVLLWLVLCACVAVLTSDTSLADLIPASLLLAALIVQFRLWDDLIDRARDAVMHPHRVLVTSGHTRSFVRLCAFLSLPVAGALGLKFGIAHVYAYGMLAAVMAMLYAIPRAVLPALGRAHLVLLKYPLFIWLCTRDMPVTRWAYLGAGVYLAICLFEILSDASLRHGVAWRVLAPLEFIVFALLLMTSIRIFL